ncbi:MAG: hypothetical protein A3G24_01005 [Betaproteobacteria bacterium RIFCSPLOWO2_12_FULL_62_13]|nr:MAG: hypothetical protein A3G24_01005 [Betaproteobacteria bacterium RIFCSPLOWO2_12_FULL_62_13]
MAVWPPLSAAQRITLAIDDLEAPGFSARSLKATLAGAGTRELRLELGTVTIHGRTWRNARVHCRRLVLEKTAIACADAVIDVGEKFPISFTYLTRAKALDVTLKPAAGEEWRLRATFDRPEPEIDITVDHGRLARLAPWLPAGVPQVSAGTVGGSMVWNGAHGVTARLDVEGFAFSDKSGLRAGEKIKGRISLDAQESGGQWRWRAGVEWLEGEVFWQPLYLRGAGHEISAEGAFDAARVEIRDGRLKFAAIGEAEFGGVWDRRSGAVANGSARTGKLEGDALYLQVLKPFLAGTALGDLRMEGGVEIDARIENAQLASLELKLDKFSVEDIGRRFGLFGVNGRVPWHYSEPTQADLAIEGGEVLRLPFGSVRLPVAMRGLRFALDKLEVPLLDGALSVNDFRTISASGGWRWRFSGGVTPISMSRFTRSVGLPTMHGTLSAVIPEVRYGESTLAVDGALVFKIFDGTVVAKNVKLIEPFGKAPRLTADLDVRHLDLELLTRTYSFGNITGRVDARIEGLELANWQPVKFDARVASSPGEYPRKISQSAVENISALGGAGAAAAIQRSFLRFFEQFGYERLGLSCVLRNNVCEMSGIEDAPYGYVIVKGGGIPAISVIGYNRRVDWQELIRRLKRIMQDNVRAVVQ